LEQPLPSQKISCSSHKETKKYPQPHLFSFYNKGIDRMSLERIFKALVSLGLSKSDARVYIFLALEGPQKVTSMVENLKIGRRQICRILINLQNKKIIVSSIKDENTYSALPFEEALELLIKTEKNQTNAIQEKKLILLENLRIKKKKYHLL
jgi:sugar-specific transcriptional regulator TrmB